MTRLARKSNPKITRLDPTRQPMAHDSNNFRLDIPLGVGLGLNFLRRVPVFWLLCVVKIGLKILNCHLVWQSHDPTLSIWSDFMKIEKSFTSLFCFGSFFTYWTGPDGPGRTRMDPDRPRRTQTDPDGPDGLGRTRTYPDGPGRTRTDQDSPGRTRTDPDGPGQIRTDPDIPGRTRKDLDGPRQTQMDPDGPGRTLTDPNRPERTWTDPDGPRRTRMDPDRHRRT